MSKKVKPKVPPVKIVNMVVRFTNFLARLRRKILPPQVVLTEYIFDHIVVNRCIYVATTLWIPNLLEDGPKSIEQLAKEAGVNCDALYRVMRAMVSVGIFKEKKDKIFENTKLSMALLYGKKSSMAALVKYAASEWALKMMLDLLQSVEKGENLYRIKYGKTFFDWVEENPEEYRLFDEAMTDLSNLSDDPIAAAYNFSHFKTIVDVGAGHGFQIATILKAYPQIEKGILFDLERVVQAAKNEDHFKDGLLTGRVEFIPGNFFEKIPEGGDAYFMKSIIHDWDDENAVKILTNCRKAMNDNSKLLIVDMVIKNDDKPHLSKILDIGMLNLFDGRERTEEEFKQILKEAGLELKRIIQTASPYSIVEAMPL